MPSNKVTLGNMCVADIRNLLVAQPATIGSEQSEQELLAKMIEDPRSRHVYVVDKGRVLIGVVRMNSVVEHLFPFSAAAEQGAQLIVGSLASFEGRTAAELMDDNPRFVHESTTLSEMASILMREKINELPVVDSERRVIGQVNVYETIKAYLTEIREN